MAGRAADGGPVGARGRARDRGRRDRRVRAAARARGPRRPRPAGPPGEAVERHDDRGRLRRRSPSGWAARRPSTRRPATCSCPGYTAPKIEWLRRVEPERYAEARRFGLPHDYLNLWLTGTFATEAGDASGTAYLDVRTRAATHPAALAAIDDARDWDAALPPVLDAGCGAGDAARRGGRGARAAARDPRLGGRRRQHVCRDRRRRGRARRRRDEPRDVRDRVRARDRARDRPAARGLGVLRLDGRLAAARVRAQLHAAARVGARPVRPRPRRRSTRSSRASRPARAA